MTRRKVVRQPTPSCSSNTILDRPRPDEAGTDTPSNDGDVPPTHNNITSRSNISHFPTPNDDSKVIHANLLIPGVGDPMKDASVVIQSGTIKYVGPKSDLPSGFQELPSTTVPYLLPGLWDCHVHLVGLTTYNFAHLITIPDVAKGIRLARNLHDLLMAGFTSVRDLGGFGPEVAKVVEDPTSGIVGPNIYSAGSALSQTAGHGDIFDMPVGLTYAKVGTEGQDANGGFIGGAGLCIVDGVEGCRKAVRLQVRRGAKVIKVFASGGVLSIADDPMRQQFSDEELSTIVEEAKRMGRLVAAHVHGKPGILAALRAGCGTLEHGTYLDDECLEIMKKQGTVYVATRTIVEEGVKHPELMSPESFEKMKVTARFHETAYKLAIKSGVTIALGTDSGISTPGLGASLGMGGSELSYAVRAGMTPLQAIRSATANGPLSLGSHGMAPKSGQIRTGYDADLIAVNDNPLEDVGLFKDPKNVTHVWKGGKLYKSPELMRSF